MTRGMYPRTKAMHRNMRQLVVLVCNDSWSILYGYMAVRISMLLLLHVGAVLSLALHQVLLELAFRHHYLVVMFAQLMILGQQLVLRLLLLLFALLRLSARDAAGLVVLNPVLVGLQLIAAHARHQLRIRSVGMLLGRAAAFPLAAVAGGWCAELGGAGDGEGRWRGGSEDPTETGVAGGRHAAGARWVVAVRSVGCREVGGGVVFGAA